MQAKRWWMLAVTCLSVVVINLDLTILNIALPDISGALLAGTDDLQWLVDAYALVFAGIVVPAGILGDRVGRKRVLLGGLAVFLAASLWCALSVSAGELIAARAIMGLGAGAVFPLSLALVSAAFGDDDRPTAVGVLAAAVAVALPLGPVLGGFLLEHFSWSSVFWVNVPAVCLALATGAVLMPESRNPAAPPLDVPGVVLSTGSVVCLVWGFNEGPERGWGAAPAWGLLAGSAVLLGAFVWRQRRTLHPLIDPALFRDRRFSWGTAATVAVSVALFATLFVFPQYLQSVVGDDPMAAGLRLLPMMGGLLVAGGLAGPLGRALGTKLCVASGLALLVGGLATLSQVHLTTGYAYVAAGLALCGLGTGLAIAAAMNAVMAAVGGDEAGTGASLNSALRQVGGAVAVAVLGGVLSSAYARHLRPALGALPAIDAKMARASVAEAVQVAKRLPAGGSLLRTAVGAAFLHGMSIVMLVCAGIAVAGLFTSLCYLPRHAALAAAAPPRPPAEAPELTGTRR